MRCGATRSLSSLAICCLRGPPWWSRDSAPPRFASKPKPSNACALGNFTGTVGPDVGEDAVEHYLTVLADKTGSLVATSARFGAMFAGCDSNTVAAVTRFGELAGVAFQLADDVLDIRSDSEVSGKTPGTDLREGVSTMPILLLRKHIADGGASDADKALLTLIDSDLSADEPLNEALIALRAHPVVDETAELAREWAGRAKSAITCLPDGDVKVALLGFADALVSRAS